MHAGVSPAVKGASGMDITEVRVFIKEGPDKKLKAYATLTFDSCFVIRNVKVIQGTKGLFVAMPSRKVRESCPKCNFKNAVRSRYCNQCGSGLPQPVQQVQTAATAVRQAEHRDIAHPITLECREMIQKKVLQAFDEESIKAPQMRNKMKGDFAPIDEMEDDAEGRDIAL